MKAKDDDSKSEPVSDKSNRKSEGKKNLNTASFDDIGLTVKNLSERDFSDFNVNHGVLITDVKPFSKAENQRLFAGLVIVEADR